jgi:hypothetical protein
MEHRMRIDRGRVRQKAGRVRGLMLLAALGVAACSGGADDCCDPPPTEPPPIGQVRALDTLGRGDPGSRYTAEITVNGRYAYSSSWGTRAGVRGNAVFVWDLQPTKPVLVDSVIVADAGTTGDIQAVADANLLVVAIEPRPRGAIALYDITTPTRPAFIGRYETANTQNGVHTAQVTRVGGRLYAFLCIDPPTPRLVVVDITDPRAPTEVWVRAMGTPFVHDVFVRDGVLLTAEWNDGFTAWDIGGGGAGGTVRAPVVLGRAQTVGGSVHNLWWLRDSVSGARYVVVGEEGPGAIGSTSFGDVHIVDVSDWRAMREVAFYSVTGAGTHNFWVDESAGVLYAAYYNAGVRAIDVRGDLRTCPTAQQSSDGRCNLSLTNRELARGLAAGPLTYVWGVDGAAGSVIASDMLNGIWRLRLAQR